MNGNGKHIGHFNNLSHAKCLLSNLNQRGKKIDDVQKLFVIMKPALDVKTLQGYDTRGMSSNIFEKIQNLFYYT